MSVRLSEDEAWAYIESCTTSIVTTLRRDGFPVALPVWFVVIEREIYVRTPARSKKVLRVTNDPRAGFLVEDGERWTELKAVSFTALASLVADDGLRAQALALLGDKYRDRRVSRARLPQATVEHYASQEAIVRLVPQGKLLTWDNSRIAVSE